jgi:hypothetical protein
LSSYGSTIWSGEYPGWKSLTEAIARKEEIEENTFEVACDDTMVTRIIIPEKK